MSTPNAPLTIRDMIEPAIMAAGGWVNTHAHADRAYTLSPDVLEMRRTCTLQQKWDALDALKRNSTEEDFYRRFSMFFENQIAQGVSALATFVDIDPQSEDRAIKAGLRAREHYQDQLTVKFANQTLKGVIHPEARKWFDIGAELVDIIGALPNHANSDYVMYLKALATLNENDGWFAKLAAQDLAERDANAAQEAFDILKELALRFPDSRYAPEARRRMHQLVLDQAKHELGVAEYYYVRHAYVAAIQHAQRVVSEFQNTPMRDDALEIIANSYDKLEMHDLAADTRRVLELNKGKTVKARR